MTTETALRNRRVLIVDDNEAIHSDFRKILIPKTSGESLDALRAGLFGPAKSAPAAPSYEVDSALQGEAALEKVKAAVRDDHPYALAFVDMRMPPGWNGVETIERIWQEDPRVQIVICTAYSDESWDDLYARFGRVDRLLILKKPFDIAEVAQLASALTEKWDLAARMRSHQDDLEQAVEDRTNELRAANESLLREVQQREAAESRLRHDAFHDSLTGLPNRSLLLEQLAKRIERQTGSAEASGAKSADDSSDSVAKSTFAVLFVDLDNFKIINDSLGHRAGDVLLVEVAQRMRTVLKSLDPMVRFESDGIARLGGDEFVVILDGILRPTDVSAVVEKLQEALSLPFSVADRRLSITASIGVALDNGEYTASELLRNADTAMYRAKHAGKARHAIFNEAMHGEAMDRLELENSIELALEREQFRVVYQPIIRVDTGNISGFEALLRWDHPARGTLGPHSFIQIAEELGVIVRVGRWVLGEACRQLAVWKRQFASIQQLTMSVNVSKRQLCEPGYCEEVGRIIQEAGLLPSDVNLEITESAIIDGADQLEPLKPSIVLRVEQTLHELKALGVKLHMDDFGTGYSSLSILHRYPFSALKIDRSFVAGMNENRSFTAVVHAITTLARNLKMAVIAEGVETREHLPAVLALDCSYVQGFLFSEGVPAEGATVMLTQVPCWLDLTRQTAQIKGPAAQIKGQAAPEIVPAPTH